MRVALLAVLGLLALRVSCALLQHVLPGAEVLHEGHRRPALRGGPRRLDAAPNYNKSADYSKKLLGVYPKSKWVDDAWLHVGALAHRHRRSAQGRRDAARSSRRASRRATCRPDAEFFLGLAVPRGAHATSSSVDRVRQVPAAQAPRHELAPYAYYERSKALMSLRALPGGGRVGRAGARSAGPAHVLADRGAPPARRGALPAARPGRVRARTSATIGADRALNDDDRLRYLLREVDCLGVGARHG